MKKFMDLTENDNIETISSVLKEEIDKYKTEYENMKQDGVIDEVELDRIITTIQELEFKARTLREKVTDDRIKTILEEFITIVNTEQINMINAKNNYNNQTLENEIVK